MGCSMGARLRAAREAKEMTQKEVREATSVSTLSYYENDARNMSSYTIKTLAEFYGVSADWLLYGEEKEPYQQDALVMLVIALDRLGGSIKGAGTIGLFTIELQVPEEKQRWLITEWVRLRTAKTHGLEEDDYNYLLARKFDLFCAEK